MSDWYPAIRECCAYWHDATMLQQTFQSFESDFENENDACIDSAKSIVECVCQIIIDELADSSDSRRANETFLSFSKWVSTTVKVLNLSRNADTHVRDLVSAHHSLTNALGELRKDCGPVSHGKPAFLDRLSQHHRRSAVLAADAIVALLHQAYLGIDWNVANSREPYERFPNQHQAIEEHCAFQKAKIDENGLLAVTIALPDGADPLVVNVPISKFLYHQDRVIYVEALNAALSAKVGEREANLSETEDA